MTFADAIALALRNLRQAPLRTALTTIGVAIGIASLAGMVSLGVGLEDQFVSQFQKSGVFDVINVTSGRVAGFGGRGGRGAGRGRGAGAPTTPVHGTTPIVERVTRDLDDKAIGDIAALADVSEVYPVVRVPMEVRLDQVSQFVTATGVPMSSRDQGAFRTFAAGGFFARESDRTCLINLDFAKRLDAGQPLSLVGRDLTLAYATADPASPSPTPPPAASPDAPIAALAAAFQVQQVETPCRVAGIVEREPGPALGGMAIGTVMIPIAWARELDQRVVTGPQSLVRSPDAPRTYQMVLVRVKRAQATQDVEDRIKAMGLSASSIADALQGAKRAFILLDILLSLIGSIALAVSSLGIVNTMVMSILERTREIGVMKAIGGADQDVRRIFLVEAAIIGVLGGAGGVVLGWIVSRAINFGANWYIASQGGPRAELFSMPLWLVASSIGFALLVSLIAGSYPARRAARLNPIDALRHD
jgi:putative ABC transport system permease protein